MSKAARRQRAKEAWARRRAAEAAKSAPVPAQVTAAPAETSKAQATALPKIAYAVREGSDVFVCFGYDGSLNREKISDELARKLLRELTAILV